jgi:hypothetical protein
MFDAMHATVVPPGCAAIETGSHEFWTAIDELLRETQADISQILYRFEGREIDSEPGYAEEEDDWESFDEDESAS